MITFTIYLDNNKYKNNGTMYRKNEATKYKMESSNRAYAKN